MIGQVKHNTYETSWSKVAEYEKKDLPKSAANEVSTILKSAIKDDNVQQIIKALLVKNKYDILVDKDDKINIFSDFQILLSKNNDVAHRSLVHSLLAELYYDYYVTNAYTFNKRKLVKDTIPNNMDEWSWNIFSDKIVENIRMSVNDPVILKKHVTKEYIDIIEQGADNAFYPTLYDFLMKRAIDIIEKVPSMGNSRNIITQSQFDKMIAPASEFIKLNISNDSYYLPFYYYKQYFLDLIDRDMISTSILTELNKAKYMMARNYSLFTDKKALIFLQALYNEYAKNETSVVIIESIADKILREQGSYDNSEKALEEAYGWCSRGINLYSQSPLASGLIEMQKVLTTPQLDINYNSTIYPDSDIVLTVDYKNLQSLKKKPAIEIYKIEGKKQVLTKRIFVDYISSKTYISERKNINIGKLEVGTYHIERKDFSEDSDNKMEFLVTRIAAFSRNNAKHAYEVYVVDRMTGHPIPNSNVSIYESDNNIPLYTSQTDINGLASFCDIKELNGDNYFRGVYGVTVGKDKYPKKSLNVNYSFRSGDYNLPVSEDAQFLSIFTDRSIYRPGQTVFFKSLLVDKNGALIPNQSITLTLENSNGDEITKKKLRTNEFGSVAGEFVLPKLGLLGSYKIIAETNFGNSVEYFKVAEYKRPTFEVAFDKIEKTYSYGEEVIVKGYARNFSGISLQNATISYSVNGESYSFWKRDANNTFFQSGELKTDANGSFNISFIPQKPTNKSVLGRANDIQLYTVDVHVTDLNGETQSGKFSVRVGDASLALNINIPDQIEKEDLHDLKIEAFNLNGDKIDTFGKYRIHILTEDTSIGDLSAEGTFKTGQQTDLVKILKQLKSAKYRISLTAIDSNGKEIKDERDFIIFSYRDKKPPITTNQWFVVKNSKFSTDLPAEIIFGVSDKDIRVVYQLYNNDKVFDTKYFIISDETKNLTIPYLPKYGDQLYLALSYIKNEKFYSKSVLLQKEQVKNDKKLNLKLDVFRNKLYPGQEETWTISVKNPNNDVVSAEVLASMYDKSLDKIYSTQSWSINDPNMDQAFLPRIDYWSELNNNYTTNTRGLGWYLSRIPQIQLHFDNLKLFGFKLYNHSFLQVQHSAYRIRGTKMVAGSIAAKQNESDHVEEPKLGEQDQVQLRRNFSETAFFYPQLKTSEKGETLISFKVPESNTEWIFRALAHDKNMNSGMLEESVITRKELMVTPNMPRFIRQGDQTNISTKISNLSENHIKGKIHIEFFDPATDKIIDLGTLCNEQDFALDSNASSLVSWTFDVPNDIELLGCRIIAQNEMFSDGEQHVLPVLSNRMLVTETMPFDVTDKGESTFVFERMKESKSTSLSNYRLTLEYSENPAWYAVMALPTLSNPQSDNASDWFASYYVNALGSSIIRQYPQIANMIKTWKATFGNKETFISKLNQNDELKNVILSETPWILDAKNQTEQMNRLSLLFDLNNTQQQEITAIDKLQNFQDEKGGWNWFKGFYPSRNITLSILAGFAHLQEVGQIEYSANIKEMQIRALNFIDKEIASGFENLKKQDKNWEKAKILSTDQIEYLYIRSYYRDIPITQQARQAERFYMDIATKYWINLDLFERSLIIRPLLESGNRSLAQDIANSLKERSVIDKSKGMYWSNDTDKLLSKSISPVEQHIACMDALYKTGATQQEMNLMKQWLIKQKQTQQWNTTFGTINAIYALINTGSNWFDGKSDSTVISVDKERINTSGASFGTGYFKTSWNRSNITKDKATITIEKDTEAPAYGALYWQYFEDLNKITSHRTNLNIDKQLLKEVTDSKGNVLLVSITDKTPLKIGDKVTFRFTVKVNNDIDYVQLKDMRASCFEPIETASGTKWNESTTYYQEVRDASTSFYFDHLRKGTYIFNYSVYVNRIGNYSNGITSIQSIYAPEYASHTQGITVTVSK